MQLAVPTIGTASGLAAAGMAALSLGSLTTGIADVAAIPFAAGLASYGVMKGNKSLISTNHLDWEVVDDVLEISSKNGRSKIR